MILNEVKFKTGTNCLVMLTACHKINYGIFLDLG